VERNIGRRERYHGYVESRRGKGRGIAITSSINVEAIRKPNDSMSSL
jgi:hypothetical protein